MKQHSSKCLLQTSWPDTFPSGILKRSLFLRFCRNFAALKVKMEIKWFTGLVQKWLHPSEFTNIRYPVPPRGYEFSWPKFEGTSSKFQRDKVNQRVDMKVLKHPVFLNIDPAPLNFNLVPLNIRGTGYLRGTGYSTAEEPGPLEGARCL